MPIYGLTDLSSSFKEIGRIRLGITKAEADRVNPATGRKQGPTELPYFRLDFRPGEERAQGLFLDAYGEEPTRINIRVPFPEIVRFWDANYEIYNKQGLLGKADGRRWTYLRDNKTGQSIVTRDGNVLVPLEGARVDDETGELYIPFDPKVPVYSYKNQKGADVAVFARPTGRLKVVIPELNMSCYMLMVTNSIYNVANISAELQGIFEMGRNIGIGINWIPMVLSRRPEMISVSYNGNKSMQEHNLCHIEVRPDWMESNLKILDAVMPGFSLPAPKMLQLPAGITESAVSEASEWGEDDDDPLPVAPVTPVAPIEPEPKPAPKPTPIPTAQPPKAKAQAKQAPAPEPVTVINAESNDTDSDDFFVPDEANEPAPAEPAEVKMTAEQKLEAMGTQLWPGAKWETVKVALAKDVHGKPLSIAERLVSVEGRYKRITAGTEDSAEHLQKHVETAWPGKWACALAALDMIVDPAEQLRKNEPLTLLKAIAFAAENQAPDATPDEITGLILAGME